MTPKFKLKQRVYLIKIVESHNGCDIEVRVAYIDGITLEDIGTKKERYFYNIKYYTNGWHPGRFQESDLIDSFDTILDIAKTALIKNLKPVALIEKIG